MGGKRFTDIEIKTIKEDFPTKGVKFCAEKLGRKASSIQDKAIALGVKRILTPKVNTILFTNDFNKYSTYILGFLWADGYLYNKGIRNNRIELEILSEDLDEIKWIFDKVGEWRVVKISRSIGRPLSRIVCNNKKFSDFLVKNDFKQKSKISPEKLLSKIPKILHNYFFLGYSDGDGTFSNSHFSWRATGRIDQEWDFLIMKGEELGIRGVLGRYPQSDNKGYSTFRFNTKEVAIFGEYLYQTYEEDRVGLKRKYSQWLSRRL